MHRYKKEMLDQLAIQADELIRKDEMISALIELAHDEPPAIGLVFAVGGLFGSALTLLLEWLT